MLLSIAKISAEPASAPTVDADRLVRCAVETVRTDEAFDALEREWSLLAEEAPVSVFQTYEWLRTWWTYFSAKRELWILLFRHDARLVGIAPMFKHRARMLGVVAARQVQFIGCGLSDYTDMIILPGYEQSVLTSFAHHLSSSPDEWDLLDMEDLSERTSAARLFPGILRNSGISVYQYQGNVCPYVELPDTAEDLIQELGSNTRYNVRRKMRHLQSQFRTEVKLFRTAEDDLEKAVTDFSFIHGERWKSLGFPSAFDNDRHRAFHVEVAKRFAKRDWLRMFFLSADDRPVAVSFCFNYRQRIYMYQSNAHGSDAVMKCSPGFLVRAFSMTEGIGEGMRVYDFLRGDEEYKYREWGAVDSRNWLLRVKSPHLLSRMRFVIFLVKELVGKIRKRGIREYYEFRRMRIAKKPSPSMLANYLLTKMFHLLRLGAQFIIRHSPLGVVTDPGKRRTGGPASYESLQESDSSFVLQYTLGQKLVRILRSWKVNNVIRKFRAKAHTQRVIEECVSAISGRIAISECGPERRLLLNDETHSLFFSRGSWAEAKREYWGAMSHNPFGVPPNASVLLCGLGGATTLHLLCRAHRPASITALEIDPVIIDLARRHFEVNTLPGLTILEGDATSSIRKLKGQHARFDLILDDVFYKITGKLNHDRQSTVRGLLSLLNPGGSIVFQRPIDRMTDEPEAARFAQSLRDMGCEVRVRKIRHRWLNDVIYCRAPRT